jgi:hypothetical protein
MFISQMTIIIIYNKSYTNTECILSTSREILNTYYIVKHIKSNTFDLYQYSIKAINPIRKSYFKMEVPGNINVLTTSYSTIQTWFVWGALVKWSLDLVNQVNIKKGCLILFFR